MLTPLKYRRRMGANTLIACGAAIFSLAGGLQPTSFANSHGGHVRSEQNIRHSSHAILVAESFSEVCICGSTLWLLVVVVVVRLLLLLPLVYQLYYRCFVAAVGVQ